MLKQTKELDPLQLNAGDKLFYEIKNGLYGESVFEIPEYLFRKNRNTFGFRKALKDRLIAEDKDRRDLLPYIETALRTIYGQSKTEICAKLQLNAMRVRSTRIVDYNLYQFGLFVADENNLQIFYECKEIFENFWKEKI